MSLRIALDNYYVILTHFLTVIISIFITFYIFLIARKNRLLYLYLLTQLLLILWVFSKILKTSAPNITLRWFFIVTQYFGICFLGSIFVMFAYTYSHNTRIKLRYVLLLHTPPILLFVIVITNPYHMMFYSTFDMYRDSFGPLFYLHQTTVYLYLVSGIILCSKGFRRQFGTRKVQATLFAIAILLPIFVNLLYVFKVFKRLFGIRLPMDITPISCIASLLIFSIAAFRYRFIDITPLAYKEALHQSRDGILLMDLTGSFLEHNASFDRWFGQFSQASLPDTLEAFLLLLKNKTTPSSLHQLTQALCLFEPSGSSIELNLLTGASYNVLVEPVFDRRKNICGSLVRFVDISSRKELLKTLKEKNTALIEGNSILEKKTEALRQLTIVEVRSHMAKEVHDILGHSVVLVLAMLEVALLNRNRQTEEIGLYLSQSVILLKNGLVELEKSSIENLHSKTDNNSLFQALQLMAGQLLASGIHMEITVQGKSSELNSIHSEALYKICREAVTNALRHGKASLINIIFRFYSDSYELYILDNGYGCEQINKGMGLKGIEANTQTIGGSLQYNSGVDSGFQLFLSVKNEG